MITVKTSVILEHLATTNNLKNCQDLILIINNDELNSLFHLRKLMTFFLIWKIFTI